MAKEDPLWGYRRIHGELIKLGAAIATPTVSEILGPRASIPCRAGAARPGGSSCSPQATGIIAVDFLHVDNVLLKRLYVLVFIEHGTRRMHLSSVTANPTGEWTGQQARNLALSLGRTVP